MKLSILAATFCTRWKLAFNTVIPANEGGGRGRGGCVATLNPMVFGTMWSVKGCGFSEKSLNYVVLFLLSNRESIYSVWFKMGNRILNVYV